jgi:glucose-6-phosphate-specific signal transduction histidine kinase
MVQLLRNENVLILGVEDNGKGFNKNEVRPGQGLFNTHTRVSSLDGTFTLESTEGKGTSVFIEIATGAPLEKPASNGRPSFPNYKSFLASTSGV